jgi:toxin ParE1/3/4
MAEIIWTAPAISDIEGIASYIALDSSRYAEITVAGFFEATEKLKQFPVAGKMAPEFFNHSIRELQAGNYRIIYQLVSDAEIHIVRVCHSSRLLK